MFRRGQLPEPQRGREGQPREQGLREGVRGERTDNGGYQGSRRTHGQMAIKMFEESAAGNHVIERPTNYQQHFSQASPDAARVRPDEGCVSGTPACNKQKRCQPGGHISAQKNTTKCSFGSRTEVDRAARRDEQSARTW